MDLAIYGYHDASVCIKQNNTYYIYEVERFFKKRYSHLTFNYLGLNNYSTEQLIEFYTFIKEQHNISEIETCFINEIHQCDIDLLLKIFDIKKFEKFNHHYSHACSVYYQSKFEDCFIITYDGGGKNEDDSESSFVVWKANNSKIEKICDLTSISSFNFGNFYLSTTNVMSSINKGDKKKENIYIGLSNAGKLMGLCSYGEPKPEYISALTTFFESYDDTKLREQGIFLEQINSLDGEKELNFAASVQRVFENKFFEIFNSLNIPINSNICLSGGCALNIKINQILNNLGYNVFVSPNSNDCGLSFGALVGHYKDKNVNITYAGYPILDVDYADEEIQNEPIDNKKLAELLFLDKKILGYIKGNSECGPRALGHRSILCYPDVLDLKNKLNYEIKFREWYRPFGAICKTEDLHKFFENACESPFMNFCPTLRPEYRLPAITHIDNTCRIQTINKDQHPELYEVLNHIEDMGGTAMLLNTSFNIKGKPILTRLKDAFDTLKQTKLSGFVYENKLYTKR